MKLKNIIYGMMCVADNKYLFVHGCGLWKL